MNSNISLGIGISLLVIGLLLPFGIFLVVSTMWPAAVKTIVTGVLTFGFEILAIPAVAIMGKENFDRIMQRVKSWFGRLKPSGAVGRLRYNIGLVLFVLPIVPTYIMAYLPQLLPDYSPERLLINIAADIMFFVSLFVLGGDFWDKLTALFDWKARVELQGSSK